MLAIAAAKALRGPVSPATSTGSRWRAADENARHNGVAPWRPSCMRRASPAAPHPGRAAPYRLIFANILLGPLQRLARPMARSSHPGARSSCRASGAAGERGALSLSAAGALARTPLTVENWTTLVVCRRALRRVALACLNRSAEETAADPRCSVRAYRRPIPNRRARDGGDGGSPAPPCACAIPPAQREIGPNQPLRAGLVAPVSISGADASSVSKVTVDIHGLQSKSKCGMLSNSPDAAVQYSCFARARYTSAAWQHCKSALFDESVRQSRAQSIHGVDTAVPYCARATS